MASDQNAMIATFGKQNLATSGAPIGPGPLVPTLIQRDQVMIAQGNLSVIPLGPQRPGAEVHVLRAENQGLIEHLRWTEDNAEEIFFRTKYEAAEKLKKEYDRYKIEFQQAVEYLSTEQLIQNRAEQYLSDQKIDEAKAEAARAEITTSWHRGVLTQRLKVSKTSSRMRTVDCLRWRLKLPL